MIFLYPFWFYKFTKGKRYCCIEEGSWSCDIALLFIVDCAQTGYICEIVLRHHVPALVFDCWLCMRILLSCGLPQAPAARMRRLAGCHKWPQKASGTVPRVVGYPGTVPLASWILNAMFQTGRRVWDYMPLWRHAVPELCENSLPLDSSKR